MVFSDNSKSKAVNQCCTTENRVSERADDNRVASDKHQRLRLIMLFRSFRARASSSSDRILSRTVGAAPVVRGCREACER